MRTRSKCPHEFVQHCEMHWINTFLRSYFIHCRQFLTSFLLPCCSYLSHSLSLCYNLVVFFTFLLTLWSTGGPKANTFSVSRSVVRIRVKTSVGFSLVGVYEDDISVCSLSGSNWCIPTASGEMKRSREQQAPSQISPVICFSGVFLEWSVWYHLQEERQGHGDSRTD